MTQWRNVASGGVARRGVDSIAGGHAMRCAQRLSVERVAMGLMRHRCLVRMRARCTVRVQRDDLRVLRVLAPLIAVTGLEARLHMHCHVSLRFHCYYRYRHRAFGVPYMGVK